MKKSLLIIFGVIIIIFACEKDDFCISNPVTPNLVLRFYDATDESTTQEVDSLYIWAEGMDTIHSNHTTDSIAIPLNTLASSTTYILAQGTQKLDTLTLEYDPEEEYVSRSCGFRIIFNNIVVSADDEVKWIQSATPQNISSINNQDQAHVRIFH